MADIRSDRVEAPVTRSQAVTTYLSHRLSFGVFVIATIWILHRDTNDKYLGGMNFSGEILNIHPFCMVLGFGLLFTEDLLADRSYPLGPIYSRYLHFCLQTAAISCIGLGLFAVIEYKDRNTVANLYPFHGWLGLAAICFFVIQYVLNILIFHIESLVTPIYRFALSPLCKFFTIFSYLTGIFTIISGISNVNTKLSCAYTVTSPDTNPASHFHLIPNGCKLSNFLGILLAILAFLVFYSVIDLKKSKFYSAFDDFFEEKEEEKIEENEPLNPKKKQKRQKQKQKVDSV